MATGIPRKHKQIKVKCIKNTNTSFLETNEIYDVLAENNEMYCIKRPKSKPTKWFEPDLGWFDKKYFEKIIN